MEQLKTGLKTKKTDCAALLANYQCGQNDILSVPSGDIIQPNVGDEIAINSIGFEVVELDGSGNGRGIVKVPMFQNAKFGVEFKGIKVAKGGCVVAGQAELSNVDVALLNEEQRKKLAETYEAFNKVLDVVDANAEGVAETFNSVWALMDGIKDRAAKLAAKLSGGQNPTAKEIKDLAKLTENSAAMLQKSLNDIKKQAKANADAGKVDEMQKIIDQQKASAKALLASAKDIKMGKDKLPTPQDPMEKANTQKQVDALAMTNGADVKKKLDGLKGNLGLAVEYIYNRKGKLYKDTETIAVGQEENNITYLFLRNYENKSISWAITDNDGKDMTQKIGYENKPDFERLGIDWDKSVGTKELKVSVTADGKTIHLTVKAKPYFVKDLVAVDGEKGHSGRKAYASKNETLYLVAAPLTNRVVDFKWNDNIETGKGNFDLFKLSTYKDEKVNFSIPLNKYDNIFQHTYSSLSSPISGNFAIDAFGYKDDVSVKVVEEDRTRVDYADKLSKLLIGFERITGTFKEIRGYFPCEIDVMSSKQLSDLIQRKQFAYTYETFNKERIDRLYNETQQHTFDAKGFDFFTL